MRKRNDELHARVAAISAVYPRYTKVTDSYAMHPELSGVQLTPAAQALINPTTTTQKGEKPMTQCDRIIDYMEKFGSITQLEAFSDLGIMRLASRISDLKKAGYNITDEMVTSRNRFGDPVSFKRYKLDEK